VVPALRAARPDFDRTVAPILITCLDCHSGAEAEGKLDLSRKQSVSSALDEVWKRVSADEMPPKNPLTADEKTVLKAWIKGGAKWGNDPIDPLGYTTKARAGRDWWAFRLGQLL
jgi:uncharacterized membrane protein